MTTVPADSVGLLDQYSPACVTRPAQELYHFIKAGAPGPLCRLHIPELTGKLEPVFQRILAQELQLGWYGEALVGLAARDRWRQWRRTGDSNRQGVVPRLALRPWPYRLQD